MSKLEYFHSLLDSNCIKRLKDRNIKSVTDFLQENPENLCKITKLHFKDVLEIRQKLLVSFRGNIHLGHDLLRETTDNHILLTTGIKELDALTEGFKSGNTYELCGLSGSGKTQICLALTANTSMKEKCVHYIDTKGDFSAVKVQQILSKKNPSKKNIVACLGRIRVTKTYTLHQLICTLHWLKNQLLYDSVPLVIIDCLSTTYFLSVGSDQPTGLSLLNHVASLVKFIALEYHTVVVITNLASKNFKNNDTLLHKSTKPCLGKYWCHVANYRFHLKKEDNYTTYVTLEDTASDSGCLINLNEI